MAEGFVAVANEAMCRPIRNLTQARGYDPANHVLSCFGGAGGQHACDVARSLGIKKVFIHKHASILSAYGMALAAVVQDETSPFGHAFQPDQYDAMSQTIDELVRKCGEKLRESGFRSQDITFTPFLNMRYDRTDCAIMCHPQDSASYQGMKHGNFEEAFTKQYRREFGFVIPDRRVIVDDIRVRAEAKAATVQEREISQTQEDPRHEKVGNHL